jgi:hypothetical protein
MGENDCYGMGAFVKLDNTAYHARHWKGIQYGAGKGQTTTNLEWGYSRTNKIARLVGEGAVNCDRQKLGARSP